MTIDFHRWDNIATNTLPRYSTVLPVTPTRLF